MSDQNSTSVTLKIGGRDFVVTGMSLTMPNGATVDPLSREPLSTLIDQAKDDADVLAAHALSLARERQALREQKAILAEPLGRLLGAPSSEIRRAAQGLADLRDNEADGDLAYQMVLDSFVTFLLGRATRQESLS